MAMNNIERSIHYAGVLANIYRNECDLHIAWLDEMSFVIEGVTIIEVYSEHDTAFVSKNFGKGVEFLRFLENEDLI